MDDPLLMFLGVSVSSSLPSDSSLLSQSLRNRVGTTLPSTSFSDGVTPGISTGFSGGDTPGSSAGFSVGTTTEI